MDLKLSPKQKNNYSVYIHTNKTSGKVYIGITKQVPERRWQNGHGYEGTYFGNAIKKYGWDGFEHNVIVTDITKEKACELGINRKGITKACQGISATYKGYVWEYADKEYDKPVHAGIGNYDHSKRRKPVAVVFPDGTKKKFSCVKEAAERLNVNYNTARRYAIDNAVDKEGRGWCYES